MSPPYIFQIDEIAEHKDAFAHTDGYGNWRPSTDIGANQDITPRVGASGRHWFCNGQLIREILLRPAEASWYKTFTVYYSGGAGFWVLQGDARNPPNDNVFHKLQFAYYDHNNDYSSYLTNAGQQHTLRLQPQNPSWAHMLLPNIYHSHQSSLNQLYGGLIGELPILLALMAFTTTREYLPSVLPYTFVGGAWVHTHQWQMPRIDRRGVVVTVYTCPANYPANAPQNWAGSTANDLYNYEMGNLGKYFY